MYIKYISIFLNCCYNWEKTCEVLFIYYSLKFIEIYSTALSFFMNQISVNLKCSLVLKKDAYKE